MASKITDQTYLVVTLSDASGTFTRDYRVDNPADSVTTLQRVSDAFYNAFEQVNSDTGTFFLDDYDDASLTKVKSVTKVALRKTETPLA